MIAVSAEEVRWIWKSAWTRRSPSRLTAIVQAILTLHHQAK
jgi:hypothetical protein